MSESVRPISRYWQAVKNVPANMSLKTQLILAVLLLVVTGLLVSGFAGATALRGYLLKRVDTQLVSTVRDTLRHGYIVSGDANGPYFNSGGEGPSLSGSFYTRLSDSDGNAAGAAEMRVPIDSKQTAPKLPNLSLPLVDKYNGRAFTVDATGAGSDWRVLVVPLSNGSGSLTVATTLSDVDSTVDHLLTIDLFVAVIVLTLMGFVGSIAVHRSLRRLSQVDATARAIAEGDMSRRVPDLPENTEVGRLAKSFNTMIERIEAAFVARQASEEEAKASEERMRRFVADASHELRTPLTSIRGFAELRRQGAANSPDLVDRSFERIESEAERMTLLVEDLLLLARLDQQRPLEHEPVNMIKLVTDSTLNAPVLAPDHNLTVLPIDVEAVVVSGDEARLHQVIANILNNAYMHTPADTDITVGLTTSEGAALLTIADNGPGMTQDESSRVFERFYRADPSRTRAQGGTGLGLSIVASIVEAHNGKVVVKSEVGEGTEFTISLPLATRDQS